MILVNAWLLSTPVWTRRTVSTFAPVQTKPAPENTGVDALCTACWRV